MTPILLRTCFLALALLSTGIARAQEIRFLGLQEVLAGDQSLHLQWTDATRDGDTIDPVTYKLRWQASGEAPREILTPDTQYNITGLGNGVTVTVSVAVMAADRVEIGGKREWFATPFPVRYVDAASTGAENGRTPATAYRSLRRAVTGTLALPGVNLYVREGEYKERFFLFFGVTIFGGFDAEFSVGAPRGRTVLIAPDEGKDLARVSPGELPCGFDHCDFRGENIGRRALLAQDSVIRLSHCSIEGFVSKGFELRGGDSRDEGLVAQLYSLDVHHNGGEGLALSGMVDVVVDDCHFHHNHNEGIEAVELLVRRGLETRLTIRNCEISHNEDVGTKVYLEPHPRSRKGRFEVTIENTRFHANDDNGLVIDLDFAKTAEIDAELVVRGVNSRDNKKDGFYLDADAPGSYLIVDSTFDSNAGSGVRLSGDASSALLRLVDCVATNNLAHGVDRRALGGCVLRNCRLAGNTRCDLVGTGGFLQLEGGSIDRIGEPDHPDGTAVNVVIGTEIGGPARLPGNPRTVPAGAAKRGRAELIAVTPAPLSPIAELRWALRFSAPPGDLRLQLSDSTGQSLPVERARPADVESGTMNLVLRSPALKPGTAVILDVQGGELAGQFSLPYTVAHVLDPVPGNTITLLPARGRFSLPADGTHEHKILLQPGTVLAITTAARSSEGRLTLDLVNAETGTVVERRAAKSGQAEVTLRPVTVDKETHWILRVRREADVPAVPAEYDLILNSTKATSKP